MKITITAYCSFCARKFDATDTAVMKARGSSKVVDGIVCEGVDGRLCCDDCLCSNCGSGHPTDADYDQCELGDAAGVDTFDPDRLRDLLYADRSGAI